MTGVLQCEGLGVRYAGNVALSDIAISVPAGRMIGLVGANGAGKSTLVNALAGWSRGRAVVSGRVTLQGEGIDHLAPHQRPRVLMLDEPSAGLAPRLISDLLSRIRLLVDRGLPVLLVEQNVKAALKVVDHLYLLERGRIVGQGPADVMAADHRIVEAYLGTIAAGVRP
jgi:ABC-type branched-subunit amino acid transport system ATPase component